MTTDQLIVRFNEITDSMAKIVESKNNDYAGNKATNAFANLMAVEGFGVSTEDGFITRMTDKLKRISNLTRQGNNVSDEKIADTLKDLGSYSILFMIYLEDAKSRKSNETK